MARTRRNREARSFRFFLAPDLVPESGSTGPVPGSTVELAEGELEHATRVLRLPVGARLEILDGRGGRATAELEGEGSRRRSIRLISALERSPLAGRPGAPLPHVELLVPPPRGARFEALLDRATQLGAARIRPLICEHTGPEDRAAKRDRQLRVLREACKQSGNLQLPALEEPALLGNALESSPRPVFFLEPRATLSLPQAFAALPETPRRLAVAAGPEGGFSPDERDLLAEAGALPVRLAPHILRIETAAEAALAIVVAAAWNAGPLSQRTGEPEAPSD